MLPSSLVFILSSSLALVAKQQTNSLPTIWYPNQAFQLVSQTASLNQKQLTKELQPLELRAQSLGWVKNNMQFATGDDVAVTAAHLDSTTKLYHCYMVKQHQGLEVVNSLVQMTTDNKGNVVAVGSQWDSGVQPARLLKRQQGLGCRQALDVVQKSFNFTEDPTTWTMTTEPSGTTKISGVKFAAEVSCKEKFYQTPTEMRQILDLAVPMSAQYLNVMVDKQNGKIHAAVDWSSDFTFDDGGRLEKRQNNAEFKYRVLQIGALDPRTVQPQVQTNPSDPAASPEGWHFAGRSETVGNNVLATQNINNANNAAAVIQAGNQARATDFNFDFQINDQNQEPNQYTDASIVNAFFVTNRYHDILYRYGFDERAGNFQNSNFGKGGEEGDAVLAITQDGESKNNANFATPPDGANGVMRMFVFDRTQPQRDGSFENSVVLHELTHGLSTRLTGGPANSNCLSTPQSGGMGEGWSDMIAMALEMESIDTDRTPKAVGQYVTGDTQRGVRQFGYTTDMTANPLKFSDAARTQQVHQLGEIWSSMLFESYWNMVNKNGFDINFRTNPDGNRGNNMFLKVVVTGMKLQPCNPTFIQARDAIIQADQQLFNGANRCELIRGFAKRGMGPNAQAVGQTFTDDFTVPPGC